LTSPPGIGHLGERRDLIVETLSKLLAGLIVAFIGFLAIPGHDMVVVYKSPEAFREAMALYDANNKTVTPAYIARTLGLVPKGTKADLMECSWSYGLNKVLITTGAQAGKVGWVPIEWYHSE